MPAPAGPRAADRARRDGLLHGAAVLCVVVAAVLLASVVVQAAPERRPAQGQEGVTSSGLFGTPRAGLERLRSTHEIDEDDQGIASLEGHAAGDFEPLRFDSVGDGRIDPAAEWVDEHIVTAEVPLLDGTVRCHELLIPQLAGALGELEDRGLAHLIDPDEYGGCWVPRHIMREPDRALSLHAWGLAVDLNVSTNPYGAEPQMDARVVEVFQRWGFAWGGHWRTPDGMHFELIERRDEPTPEDP